MDLHIILGMQRFVRAFARRRRLEIAPLATPQDFVKGTSPHSWIANCGPYPRRLRMKEVVLHRVQPLGSGCIEAPAMDSCGGKYRHPPVAPRLQQARLNREMAAAQANWRVLPRSFWSDGRRRYVLLFNTTEQELHAYMTKMGITV